MSDTKYLQRNSSIELLRLICMFGIISMHVFGAYGRSCVGGMLIWGVLINSIFNMGVSLFMLISGWFSIKKNPTHLFALMCEIWFFSILSALIQYPGNIKELIRACFPITMNLYWYMTSYVLIFLFADYINNAAEKMEKQSFFRMLCLLIFIAYCIPTILFGRSIMNDGGKGPLNMLTVYFIGRYLRKYHTATSGKRYLCIAIGTLVIEFLANYTMSILSGGQGLNCPYAYDNSLLILVGSVSVFLFAQSCHFSSKLINQLAIHVPAIYLFEGTIRFLLNQYICLDNYAGSWIYPVVSSLLVLIVMGICMAINFIRTKTIAKLELPLYRYLEIHTAEKVTNLLNFGCKKA